MQSSQFIPKLFLHPCLCLLLPVQPLCQPSYPTQPKKVSFHTFAHTLFSGITFPSFLTVDCTSRLLEVSGEFSTQGGLTLLCSLTTLQNYYSLPSVLPWTSLVAQRVKRLHTMRETWVQSLGQEDLLEKGMATHSSILPGKFHGRRRLVGYSPWGRKESDTTERLHSPSVHFQINLFVSCFKAGIVLFPPLYVLAQSLHRKALKSLLSCAYLQAYLSRPLSFEMQLIAWWGENQHKICNKEKFTNNYTQQKEQPRHFCSSSLATYWQWPEQVTTSLCKWLLYSQATALYPRQEEDKGTRGKAKAREARRFLSFFEKRHFFQ